ncbi:MAG: hypothetical protein R2867_19385 [Caldilineaceae bacterium]
MPAAVALLWMVLLSRPLFSVSEGAGTAAVLAQIHESVPPNAVLLFEDQDGDSWIGWLAAPLYSIYGDWALLFDGDQPDPTLLQQAADGYTTLGRSIYLVTQQPELPVALLPAGYRADLVQQLPWQSTLIGQTTAPYPPPIWYFLHPVNLYRLERQ